MDNDLIEMAKRFERERGSSVSEDQCFVINPKVLDRIIEVAQVTKEDRVLEVGTGLGFLTRRLASVAREVITIERDVRFKPYLSDLPRNVEVIFGDAYRLINDRGFQKKTTPPTKTVSNIPYSQAQSMLHNYTNWTWYQGDLVWLAPLSLANKINKEPILGAFFKAEVIETVSRDNFYPKPNTVSGIMIFRRVPDPISTDNFEIYFRRWLYNHEDKKVRNTIREGIINVARDMRKINITKNQAEKLIEVLNLPDEHLEIITNNIRPEYYFEIPQELSNWFNSL